MVFQVMSPATRENAPERKRDGIWLSRTTNGSTKRAASRLSVLASERPEAPAEGLVHRATCTVATNSARDSLPEIDRFQDPRGQKVSHADTQSLRRGLPIVQTPRRHNRPGARFG